MDFSASMNVNFSIDSIKKYNIKQPNVIKVNEIVDELDYSDVKDLKSESPRSDVMSAPTKNVLSAGTFSSAFIDDILDPDHLYKGATYFTRSFVKEVCGTSSTFSIIFSSMVFSLESDNEGKQSGSIVKDGLARISSVKEFDKKLANRFSNAISGNAYQKLKNKALFEKFKLSTQSFFGKFGSVGEKCYKFTSFIGTKMHKGTSFVVNQITSSRMYTTFCNKFLNPLFTKEISGDRLFGKVASATSFTSIVSKFGATFGIDYVLSLASNGVAALVNDGEVDLEDLKFGSTALKSSTRTICGIVGELIGGKAGKIVGSSVGVVIAEWQVELFTDENGNIDETACGIATGMQIAGAAIGLALYVVFASTPIGWVAGLAILAGAAIGFAIAVYLDDIVEAVGEARKKTGAFIACIGDNVTEFGNNVSIAGEVVQEASHELAKDVYNVGSDIYNVTEDLTSGMIDYTENGNILEKASGYFGAGAVYISGTVVSGITYAGGAVIDAGGWLIGNGVDFIGDGLSWWGDVYSGAGDWITSW